MSRPPRLLWSRPFFIFTLSGPAFIVGFFVFCSGGGDLNWLVLSVESWKGFVEGGGLDGRDGRVDLPRRVEDSVSSLENTLVSLLRESQITYVSPNIYGQLIGPNG